MEQIIPIVVVALVALAIVGALLSLHQRDVLSSAILKDIRELAELTTTRSKLPDPCGSICHLDLAVHLLALEAGHASFISGARNPWAPLQADNVDVDAARRVAATFTERREAYDQIDARTSKLAELALKHAAVHPERSGLASVVLSEVCTRLSIQAGPGVDEEATQAIIYTINALRGLQDVLIPDVLLNPHRPLGHVAIKGA